MDTARRDNGSIVLGWLTKLIVVLGLGGLIAFDGLSIAAAHLTASDDASQAASVASADYLTTHNVQSAYQAALDTLTSGSETLPPSGFVVDSDGTVHVVLHKTITTLLVHRIGPLKKYAEVTVHGEASPPTE